MEKYLFTGFLKEQLLYEACKAYWQAKVEDFFERNKIKDAKPYLNTKFADGTDFFNGNPIINYRIENIEKAIRIIQDEPNSNDLEITAWIDDFETDEFKTSELVISLQLTPFTERIAFDLIDKWIIDNYSASKMTKFIELKLELEKMEI